MSAPPPPQDPQAEQAVLGGMLLSVSAIADVTERLHTDDFYQPANQYIFAAVLGVHGRGDPVDPITVADELDRRRQLKRIGGAPYLHTLISTVPAPGSAGYYARIVAAKALKRRLTEAGTRIAAYGYSDADDSELTALIDRAQGDILALTNGHGTESKKPDPAVIDGAAFILDQPTDVPARWGAGTSVLWPDGEALMIAGPQGLCKTTMAGLLVRAQLGLGDGLVLGLPVAPLDSIILYLGMDRPSQIARSLARQFTGADRQILKERLVIRRGPPPADLAMEPTLLAGLADRYDAGVVYVDSLKDAALRLSTDEVGAAYNRARQLLLMTGCQLCELHHTVKRGPDGGPPKSIADIFGSTWLTNGAGSVILLSGEPGDPIIGMQHVKQPAGEVGPWRLLSDPDAGNLTIEHEADLVDLVRAKGVDGLIARDAAAALFDTDKPTRAQKEKARRKLVGLQADGVLVCVEHNGTSAYFLAERGARGVHGK